MVGILITLAGFGAWLCYFLYEENDSNSFWAYAGWGCILFIGAGLLYLRYVEVN